MNCKKIFFISAIALIGVIPASAQKKSSIHERSHKNLMATRNNTKENLQIVPQNNFVELWDEPEPEPDIYTEGWNSKRVNPYNEADVPFKAIIDVRNYCIPVPGQVSSNYGYRPKFGRMHKGVDLHLNMNDTVYAAFDGKVRLTNYEAKGYGNYIILRHPNSLETVYGHLNKILVKPDQVVRAGQAIGLGGTTGRSTGPHLHFETRYMGYAINPQAIFDFVNKTTHTDTYTFTKNTYTQPRNFAPREMASKNEMRENPYQPAEKQDSKTTYTVRQGDTIASVARTNGISKTRLLQLNNMKSSDVLKVGQVLKVK
jgi:murein DD-endopeptidase MepM/ murein hydrolase activator NlpD